jgi:hypothetical protein
MQLLLTRFPQNTCTLGVLSFAGVPRLVTLEPPWLSNRADVSCIPPDEYRCSRVFARTLHSGHVVPETFEVTVDGRSGILFHIGNQAHDTHGCILVGRYFSCATLYDAIEDSLGGFSVMLKLMDEIDECSLVVES